MYIGTHAAPQKRRSGKKPLLLLVSLVLVLALSIGGTLAWLTSQAEVTNTFEPGKVHADITEDFNGTVKSAIYVSNGLNSEDANVDAYIRAAVVINCVDENGNIIAGTIPELDYNNTDWVKGSDGYYYYKHVVAPMGKTDNLLSENFSLTGDDGVNYRVDVLAQAIQTVGGAVEEAWNMSYNGGNWA